MEILENVEKPYGFDINPQIMLTASQRYRGACDPSIHYYYIEVYWFETADEATAFFEAFEFCFPKLLPDNERSTAIMGCSDNMVWGANSKSAVKDAK